MFPSKLGITKTIIKIGYKYKSKLGVWSSGMILASGARGREFDSRNTPLFFCFYILVPLLLSNSIMLLPHVCSFCFYINSFRYTVCCIGHTDISFTFFQKKKDISSRSLFVAWKAGICMLQRFRGVRCCKTKTTISNFCLKGSCVKRRT